ncbi:MAG TPA: hypothetical protein VGO62_15850 [Myxococcota bacterium]|jgi:hypothetical protein
MGLLSIFGGDKPNQKNIEKLVVKVKERYAQPEYRREAMERLLAWGTHESIMGALARFTVVAQSPHWDEEEKRWLVDELAALGEPARAALKAFLAKENHIAFAAKALHKLDGGDAYLLDLIGALSARPPAEYRSTQGKAELVACLRATNDARAAEALLPYLDDHGDDVQCACVDALEAMWPVIDGLHDGASKKLQAVISEDARSARVLRHTAAAMQRLGIGVDATKALAPAVAEDYVVKDGKLARAGT